MDGNGRWAAQRGLPRLAGHRAGANTVKRVIRACGDLKIRFLTLYAFSTENWKRPSEEVDGLMALLRQFIRDNLKEIRKRKLRLHAVGQLHRLPEATRTVLRDAMHETRNFDTGTLTLCLSYGSREEIAHAAREIARQAAAGEICPEDVDEDLLGRHLYTTGLPDPDLVIRTSGENRLSNFLLWQASYAEFYVTPTLWPDFSREEFNQAVADFANRDRRYGGVRA